MAYCQMCADKEVEISTLRQREDYLREVEKKLADRLALAEKKLKSIADNTCCDGCQEAGRVAQSYFNEAKDG